MSYVDYVHSACLIMGSQMIPCLSRAASDKEIIRLIGVIILLTIIQFKDLKLAAI